MHASDTTLAKFMRALMKMEGTQKRWTQQNLPELAYTAIATVLNLQICVRLNLPTYLYLCVLNVDDDTQNIYNSCTIKTTHLKKSTCEVKNTYSHVFNTITLKTYTN